MKSKNLIKKFEEFMKTLKREDRIAVLHHTDPDGICSAVILNKAVKRIRGRPIDLRINQKPDEIFITNKTFKKIKENKINKVFGLDLCMDQFNNTKIKNIEKFAKVLVLDHHKLYKNLNSNNTILIKPQMIFSGVDESSYCTSKLAFDLLNNIVEVNDLDWLVVVSIIGDCAYDYWKDFTNSVLKRHNIKKRKNILNTEIGKITELIFSIEAYDVNKIEDCYNILMNSKSYKDVLNSELKNYKKEVDKEINYWKSNVEKLAEVYKKQELIFDYIKPRYSIKSAISTMLSYKYPNKTVVIAQDMNKGFIQLSARRRDNKIAVNDLLYNALKNLSCAKGGGHLNSAGGRLRKKDLFVFKENVLRILNSREVFR